LKSADTEFVDEKNLDYIDKLLFSNHKKVKFEFWSEERENPRMVPEKQQKKIVKDFVKDTVLNPALNLDN
jgi:hypothetical protein